MPRLYFHVLLITNLLFSHGLWAQKIDHLSISATTETYAFPFTRFLPLHPGAEIGLGLFNAEKNNSVHNINVLLGGYHHKKVENAIYLRAEYVYRYKIRNIISIDGPVGIGYQHSFYPGDTYQQNSATGEWENKRQVGKPHFLISFGLGLTYVKPNRIQPFVRYESNIDIPIYNSFLTTRTFFKIGINIKMNQNESN